MQLILVDKNSYQEAIRIQREIFPNEDGALNILASLDRELFQKVTGLLYPDDHVKYYLAEDNHGYVGITGLYYYDFDPESAWLGWYGILKQYRKQGFGKELLEKTQELAISQGFKYLRLYTDAIENQNAIKLYEASGFVGETYTAEKLAYDCRIYSKSLTNTPVPLWSNRKLDLAYQSELDQMVPAQIRQVIAAYEEI